MSAGRHGTIAIAGNIHDETTTTRQRERKLTESSVGFRDLKAHPRRHNSNKATPPNLPKEFHQLDTKLSNILDFGDHSH